MFYCWFFCSFLPKTLKFGSRIADWVLAIKSKHFRNFIEFSWFFKILSLVVRQLVRQLVHAFSGDNNLVSFHMWWKEIVLKPEKICKYFVQDCRIILKKMKYKYKSRILSNNIKWFSRLSTNIYVSNALIANFLMDLTHETNNWSVHLIIIRAFNYVNVIKSVNAVNRG